MTNLSLAPPPLNGPAARLRSLISKEVASWSCFFWPWPQPGRRPPTPQKVDALMKLDLAAGVDVEIKL